MKDETVIQIKNETIELEIKTLKLSLEDASALAKKIENLVLERLVEC